MQISGSNARTDVSSRPTPAISDDARFSKIETVTIAAAHGVKHLTGSLAGSSGFIVKTAGTGVITATDGGEKVLCDTTSNKR